VNFRSNGIISYHKAVIYLCLLISTISTKNIAVTKILILTANPTNSDRLRLDEEVREIQQGLRRSRHYDQFEIIARWAVRPRDLRQALLDHEPQIVHFAGHGAGSDGLVLEGNDGQVQLVSTKSLSALFKHFQQSIECVLLNACYSQEQARAIHQHINCVIGMSQSIGDRAVIEFAVGFYDSLGAGSSYGRAFELGRVAIALAGLSESEAPQIHINFSESEPPSSPGKPNMEGGTMDLLSPFYVERSTDAIALNEIERSGGITMTIKGPRQIGKSSLLMRLLAKAEQVGKRVVYLDFQELDQSILQDADRFYQHFCTQITAGLNLSNDPLDLALGRNFSCGRYVESKVLRLLNNPVVLAIDKVERVFGTEFQSDFFSMLRSWHNRRAITPLWRQLDLVMITAMEPYRLISDLNLSPFNVGRIIDLVDFSAAQVTDLNQRYHSPLNPQQLQQLMGFLSGHPYLTMHSLQLLAANITTMLQLFDRSTTYGGHFDDHFRMFRLDGRPELQQGLLEVIRHQRCTDESVLFLLLSVGLVCRKGNRVLPRCQLYADYFQDHLYD
jgi:AAA-like domain/CHAT domain